MQCEAPRAGCVCYSSSHRTEPRSQDGRHSWHEGHLFDSAGRRPESRWERDSSLRSTVGSVMYVALDRLEILHATNAVASFMQPPTKSAMVYLLEILQSEWVYSRQGVPKYLDVYGDSDWAGDEEWKRSTLELQRSSEVIRSTMRRRRNRWSRCSARRRSSMLPTAGPRMANVSVPDRGGLRGDFTSVERQQCLPRDHPQARHKQA